MYRCTHLLQTLDRLRVIYSIPYSYLYKHTKHINCPPRALNLVHCQIFEKGAHLDDLSSLSFQSRDERVRRNLTTTSDVGFNLSSLDRSHVVRLFAVYCCLDRNLTCPMFDCCFSASSKEPVHPDFPLKAETSHPSA